MTVVVIGGGLAGSTAALDLAEAGARVVLLEGRPRLGGATASFERDGLTVDTGQHVFLRCCTAYRRLLERLGTAGATRIQDRLDLPVVRPGGRVSHLRRIDAPPPWHLAAGLARFGVLPLADRLRLPRAVLPLRRLDPDDPANDQRSFGDWLAEHGQRPAAIDGLWSLIATPTLNLDPARASLAAAAFVFRTGLLAQADAADLGVPQVPLSELHGKPAAAKLAAAGVGLRLGTKATSVEPAGTGFDVATTAGPVRADAVVLAVPHQAAAALAPDPLPAAEWARLSASPIVDLHVVYDRPVTDLPFAAGAATEVQWVFDRTRAGGLARGQYLVVSLSAADAYVDLPLRDLRERFLPQLARLFPRAATAAVEQFFVTRERRATFAATPGTAAVRPSARTALPGLFLAGAWTATGWPDTMEGAVRSGAEAARLTLSRLSGSSEPVGVPA
jgi:squalene-associated FAD-dependent desaturase